MTQESKNEWVLIKISMNLKLPAAQGMYTQERERRVTVLPSIWIVLAWECNSGEILDQKIICKADEAMLLVKREEPHFLLMPG